MSGRMLPPVAIATNNGDIGGGEVMLQRLAEALQRLGVDVTVVAPEEPGDVARTSAQAGFRTVVLPAHGRQEWMLQLRRWHAGNADGLLWCNGLVPATATAGHANRLVHLHQLPQGAAQRAAAAVARRGARATVVPSAWMRSRVAGAHVLPNWTLPQQPTRRSRTPGEPFTIGFLGRPSPDKGVPVLAEAVRLLDGETPGGYRLVIGGEPRFVTAAAQRQTETALDAIAPLVDRRGWVAPAALFDDVDVLAVPSVQPESFGLGAAEAMAACVPLVVSDAGALPEIVGPDGTVVPTGDASALAAAIRAQASRSPEHTAAAADAALARWQRLFSPDAGTAAVDALLRSILGA